MVRFICQPAQLAALTTLHSQTLAWNRDTLAERATETGSVRDHRGLPGPHGGCWTYQPASSRLADSGTFIETSRPIHDAARARELSGVFHEQMHQANALQAGLKCTGKGHHTSGYAAEKTSFALGTAGHSGSVTQPMIQRPSPPSMHSVLLLCILSALLTLSAAAPTDLADLDTSIDLVAPVETAKWAVQARTLLIAPPRSPSRAPEDFG